MTTLALPKTALIPLLALAAVALPGCRSDGGFGRTDSARSLAWSSNVAARRMHDNVERTTDTLSRVDDAIANDFATSWDRLEGTLRLYVEGTEGRR